MKSKVETERNNYNVADEKMSGTVCSIWDQTTVKISFMRVNAAAVITHFFPHSKNINWIRIINLLMLSLGMGTEIRVFEIAVF